MSEVVVNRYSDEDLEEFRALIEKKIDGPDSFIIHGSQTTPEGIIEGKSS